MDQAIETAQDWLEWGQTTEPLTVRQQRNQNVTVEEAVEEFFMLFRDLGIARADGSLRNVLQRLSRADVLVVDDWAMAPLTVIERRDFWAICEDRYQTRSTVLTSQVPVAGRHEQIGDATVADGMLDRLVHNAHRIELKGDSMRRVQAGKAGK